MKKSYLRVAVMAMFAGVMMTGCGSSKQVATQQQTGGRVKRATEECEVKALESPKRAVGTATSQSERLAKNAATLDARTNLQSAIQTMLVGMIKNFDKEHQFGANANKASSFVSLSGQEQKGIIDGVLSSNIICSNTYDNPDGSITCYVCVEMSDGSIGALHKQLSADQKIAIDFDEAQFRKEMEKELENFRNRQ